MFSPYDIYAYDLENFFYIQQCDCPCSGVWATDVSGIKITRLDNIETEVSSRFAASRFAESRFAESCFAESRLAESRFAETRFAH